MQPFLQYDRATGDVLGGIRAAAIGDERQRAGGIMLTGGGYASLFGVGTAARPLREAATFVPSVPKGQPHLPRTLETALPRATRLGLRDIARRL